MSAEQSKKRYLAPDDAGGQAQDRAARVEVSSRGLVICLFTLSFATVLFTLAIFKLLSFFIMPSLFFDLLFIGFPIGAFLGVAFFRVHLRSFVNSLWVLQVVTVLSICAVLAAKNLTYFDYLRAHLFDVEVLKLLFQMGTFTAVFLPFFAAYGLSEYIGYQYGRRLLGGRMKTVYALYLFGAAGAYVFFKVTLPHLGIFLILCVAFGAIGFSIASLASGLDRVVGVVEILGVAVLAVLPSFGGFEFDQAFLEIYKGGGANSTKESREQGFEIVYQKWGRYSLCEIMTKPGTGTYLGFYNDFFQWEYDAGSGFGARSLGVVPILETPPSGRIAIIGAGGGRQVQYARKTGHSDITAIEIEPAVMDAVREARYLRDEFDSVYEAQGVTPVCREARGFMEEQRGAFDLIYLPSVGGYPQMMMEPGNLIRTHEAYLTLKKRLSSDGLLAIWYPLDLDEKRVLTEQYVRTLRQIGLKTRAYTNPAEILILAYRNQARQFPSVESMAATLAGPSRLDLPPRPELLPTIYEVPEDPAFTPITDDKPFLAGNVRHILSLEQVAQLFAICGGTLAIVGLALFVGLRRRGDPGISGCSYWRVGAVTLLIGANFLVMEHFLVLALFKRTFVYYDSLMVGAIGFLVLSGIGSIFASGRVRRVASLVGAVAVLVLMIGGSSLPVGVTLTLMAPIAIATGTLFPALFDLAAKNPLAVFALDAIGAGFGTLLATFIPIALGFSAFFVAAGVIFLVTAISCWLFFRRVD